MDPAAAPLQSAIDAPPFVGRDVPLAPMTTLGTGGPAAWLWPVEDSDDVVQALDFATRQHLPWWVLGGGSNVIVADDGLPGVVLHPHCRDVATPEIVSEQGDQVVVQAPAGMSWDGLVAWSVAAGLQGLECLSGIPGQVGAAPIQNIGAYGQEVGEVLVHVDGVDVATRQPRRWLRQDCALGYRDSLFKRQPRAAVVLSITVRLVRGGAPCLRYPQVAEALGGQARPAALGGLADVRAAVLALRRAKGMVVDSSDPDSRSCGSFFVNPVVSDAEAAAVRERLAHAGAMPSWPSGQGQTKLSAAWLIEQAGWRRGDGNGTVGLSTKHALAVVHRGGGTSAAVLDFAAEVAHRVQLRCGVTLTREPVRLG
jgi:UDP-N-acetylmuramate dehydrogenase